jgi:hypothetical protein
MSRVFTRSMLAPVFLLLLACVADAQELKSEFAPGPPNERPLWSHSFYAFNRNVPLPSFNFSPVGVIGVGYELRHRLATGSRWSWSASGEYGLGGIKDQLTSAGTTSTQELSVTNWSARLGMDYWHDENDDYFSGPGIRYVSTTTTFKSSGGPDDKLKPFGLIGADVRVGGSVPLSGGVKLFGQASEFMGYGSYDETKSGDEQKFTGWFAMHTWSGGLRVKF